MLPYFTALGWHLISYLYIQVSYTITCYQIQSTLYRHQIVPVNRGKYLLHRVKPRVNGHNIVGQQLPTLLDVTCCVCLHILLHVVGTCSTMFENSRTFSYMQMDTTTPNIGWQCCVRLYRACRKILLPLVLVKKTFCYRKESVRSGSTTHQFLMKLVSDIHWYFLQHVDLLFVCLFFFSKQSKLRRSLLMTKRS